MSFLSVANWISDSFPYVRLVMMCLIVAVGIPHVIVKIFKPTTSSGMGALTGQRDTFYAKDKSKSLESVMKRVTIALGIVEGVLAVLFFVSLLISQG